MQPAWIEDVGDLRKLVARLGDASEVAIDAEGDGFFRYRARLCTLQLGWPDGIAVLDTLALDDLTPLAPLLHETGPRKLIHDAAFDVRLLREVGIRVGNVFDTSVAARYLGEPATGLASLVGKYFDVKLDKSAQQLDWGRRPLDAAAMAYLADDVRYLLPLAEKLRDFAQRRGVEAEIVEESNYVVERALERPEPARPPWIRVKGARDLSAESLVVLRELAQLRELRAQAVDVPPFRILSDGALVELARVRPRAINALHRVRLPPPQRSHLSHEALLQAIARGMRADSLTDEDMQALRGTPPSSEKRRIERARAKALTRWREETAKLRGVDAQVVLPGHCLQDLAKQGVSDIDGLRGIAGMGNLRIERDGERIVALLKVADDRTGAPPSA